MKVKRNKFILIVMVLSFLFSIIGCGSSNEKEVHKEIVETRVDTEERDNLIAEIIYLSEIAEHTEGLTLCFENLGNLFGYADIEDEAWNLLVIVELLEMESLIEKIRAMKAPLKYEEAHKILLKAMDYYEVVPKYLPEAIDNQDIELLNEITHNMEMGNLYIDLSVEMFE